MAVSHVGRDNKSESVFNLRCRCCFPVLFSEVIRGRTVDVQIVKESRGMLIYELFDGLGVGLDLCLAEEEEEEFFEVNLN